MSTSKRSKKKSSQRKKKKESSSKPKVYHPFQRMTIHKKNGITKQSDQRRKERRNVDGKLQKQSLGCFSQTLG